MWLTAAIMPATVSPVMVGAEAASPQPTVPSSDSMRTSTLSARVTVSPAIFTGLPIGRLTAMGSMALMRTLVPGEICASVAGQAAWRQGGRFVRNRPELHCVGALTSAPGDCHSAAMR